MVTFLTAEYLDRATVLARQLPEAPGVSGRVQHVVSGAPDGDVAYVAVVEDGRTLEQRLGSDPEVDVTLTTAYDDAVGIATGELDASAAFMQGRVKVVGPMALVMGLLAVAGRPEHRAIAEQLRSETEF